jgi:hypothetical protein
MRSSDSRSFNASYDFKNKKPPAFIAVFSRQVGAALAQRWHRRAKASAIL